MFRSHTHPLCQKHNSYTIPEGGRVQWLRPSMVSMAASAASRSSRPSACIGRARWNRQPEEMYLIWQRKQYRGSTSRSRCWPMQPRKNRVEDKTRALQGTRSFSGRHLNIAQCRRCTCARLQPTTPSFLFNVINIAQPQKTGSGGFLIFTFTVSCLRWLDLTCRWLYIFVVCVNALRMSNEQGVAYRKGSVTRTYPRGQPKGSVGSLDAVHLSPTVKSRPYRRTLSLELQLDDVRMGSKKSQTMAFEELLETVLKHFGESHHTHTNGHSRVIWCVCL